MLRLTFLTTCLLAATGAYGNEPPPIPEGGLNHHYSAPCTDNETGEAGYCYFASDAAGNHYLSFVQEGHLMFIRKIVGDGYETIWVDDKYNSI